MIEVFNNTLFFVWWYICPFIAFVLTASIFLFALAFIWWIIPTSIEKVMDLIDDWKEKRAKKLGKKPKLIPYDPEKVKRAIQERIEWKKRHPILSFFIELRRILWYRVPDYPSNIKFFVREKYQRAVRGWSVSDVWSLGYYLSKVILESVTHLKNNHHGIPAYLSVKGDDDNLTLGSKKWEDILDSIIWTFEKNIEMKERNLYYIPSSQWTSKKYVEYNTLFNRDKDPDYNSRVMTLEESKKYEKGWKMLQKYYENLLD